MKRIALLALVLLAACCFAQQPTAPATDSAAPSSQYAAPVPGHPLDPADVAVLTGKSSATYAAPANYAAPAVYLNGADRYYCEWSSGPFMRSRSGFFVSSGFGHGSVFSLSRRPPFFFGGHKPFLFGFGRPFRGFGLIR